MKKTAICLSLLALLSFGTQARAEATEGQTEIATDILEGDYDFSGLEQVTDEELDAEEGTEGFNVTDDDATAALRRGGGFRRGPGRGWNRPGRGWNRPGRGWNRPGRGWGWNRPGRGWVPVPVPVPVPGPGYNMSCFAQNNYGQVFRAYGYANRGHVQRVALNECYRGSSFPNTCVALGCR